MVLVVFHSSIYLYHGQLRGGGKQLLHVPNMRITTRRRVGSLLWFVLIHLELVLLTN